MELKDLVGYQLVSIDNKHIVVSKDKKTYVLNIEEDEGGCCGYNELKTEMLIEENSKANPIITKIEYKNSEDGNDQSTCKIVFYGINKLIATIDSLSSSDSGWCYGACVTVDCKELNISETITQY